MSRSELEPYLLEVHLDHLIPHTKEMWKPSTVEYSPTNRHQSFYELIVEPTWYNVLVVPRYVNKGKEFFDVAVPIKATVTDEELPVIMQGLQFPVDEKSTHSALYRPGNFFLLNERLEFEGVNWPSDEANLGLLN